ncbi:MAG: phosphatidate cytidylyltransferase [Candidatus Cloacimonetes bacterium]|nr:phosphatidate cytidylyltransferase [Candidatus Cloacimonadota bacterium]
MTRRLLRENSKKRPRNDGKGKGGNVILEKVYKIIFRDKKQIELARKSIHISSILLPVAYRYVYDYNKKDTLILLLFLTLLSIGIELLRLENKNFQKYFLFIFGVMLRKHEINDFTGASYLLTSAIVCVAFFPADIAFAAMAFLSIGDTVAALVGMNFGKRIFIDSSKTFEGTLACFVATFLFGLFVFWNNPGIAFFGALAVCISEAINIKIDDNVKIPIISGIVMSIVFIFT